MTEELIIFDDGSVALASVIPDMEVKVYKSDANFVERVQINSEAADEIREVGLSMVEYKDKLTVKDEEGKKARSIKLS